MRNLPKGLMLCSLRLWAFLVITMLPMIACLGLTEYYNLGPITFFNLFMVSLAIALGLAYKLRPLISFQMPKTGMRPWQWEFGIEILGWLKEHESVAACLLMLGLLVIFVPLNALWVCMVSAGIIFSGTSAITCLMLLLLPFFIVPYGIITVAHESIVKPENPSLSQIFKIVEKIHAPNQLTGETLEHAKRTLIVMPGRKTRIMTIPFLVTLVAAMTLLQLVELEFLSPKIVVFVQCLMIVEGLAMLSMLALTSLLGEKKTQLDILLEEEKIGIECSEITNMVKSYAKRIRSAIEKLLDRINESVWFRIVAVLGVIMGFLVSILSLMGFI